MSSPLLTIRPARLEEHAALEALMWRSALANAGDRAALLAHPDAVAVPIAQIEAGDVLVAEREGVVIGFAALLPREDGDLGLDGLFVEPGAWRRGVGRALVARCCERADAAGARFLHVEGHPEAESFYRACGFEICGASATRFGPAFLMRRHISPASPPGPGAGR